MHPFIRLFQTGTRGASAAAVAGLVLLTACDRDPATAPATGLEPDLKAAAAAAKKTHPRGIVETVPAPSPWGVAVRDDGFAMFTSISQGGVGFTHTKARTVSEILPTGSVPVGIDFSPDGGTAYVANEFGDVSVIDVASRQITASIAIDNPFTVHVSANGARLFVGTGSSGEVVVVNTATLSIVRRVPVGTGVNAFAVHPNGRLLYASSFIDGVVAEIDMATGDRLRTFTLDGVAQEMALNRKGTSLYVANEIGFLDQIDLASGEVVARMPLAGGGFGVGVTPDDNQAYVTIPFSGLIQIFKLQARKLAKTIDVGGEPRRVAFSRRGHIAAVTNQAGFITFVR